MSISVDDNSSKGKKGPFVVGGFSGQYPGFWVMEYVKFKCQE